MKISLLIPALIAFPFVMTDARAESSLEKEFQVTMPTFLRTPFEGVLRDAIDKKEDKYEVKKLNYLSPSDNGRGFGPINTFYIASSNDDGKSHWGAFALRHSLPTAAEVFAITDYEKLLKILGEVTHPPLDGEIDDESLYDTVSWRLFRPIDAKTIEVISVSVARKWHKKEAKPKYQIEKCQVASGIFKKSEQAGADQPATKPADKPAVKDQPATPTPKDVPR